MNVRALIEIELQEPIRVHQEALLWGKMCWRRARSLCVKSVLDVLWTSEWACGFQVERIVEMFSVVSFTFHQAWKRTSEPDAFQCARL